MRLQGSSLAVRSARPRASACRCIRPALFALLLGLLFAAGGEATTFVVGDDADLLAASEVVVVGTRPVPDAWSFREEEGPRQFL